ncbi:two-component response regulator-like APRR3 isoform X2 [Hibiscus syriacus]|uniref:two-component response regulator-like APRR3 isoform X2 n=1 Tax=Hibiscus syriacus TaxID=106335 RepID=UPI0019223661|nr:two-component response regulator-like APRR3 isoform X2 [Hibiscus syriacus]
MGEATMEVDVEVGAAEERKNNDKKKKNEENDGSSEVVRWDKFLPRMVLRVLLVEADDSTRQIISALLRKCSYRVVAAVPDGLIAWETLKDRPHNIDLILTEVELPSISGFSLLTLIMEHDICKNIPVIMMSSEDSITTVLKCMLKGAADFLIKPVRRNELRNLWQHVWRRHMLASGGVPLKLTSTENNVETNAESASSQFTDYGSSTQKNKEESDSKGLSEGKRTSAKLSDTGRDQQGNVVKMDQESLRNGGRVEGISYKTFILENSNRLVKVKEVAHCSEACESDASKLEQNSAFMKGTTHGGCVGQQSNRGNTNSTRRVGCNNELVKPPTGAIDLIGSFDNQPKGTFALSSSSDGTDKFELSHELELSLRRSHSNSYKNQCTSERPTLNHSNASAFSWYNNSKSSQAIFSTPTGNQDALKEDDSKSKLDVESNKDTSKPHVVPLSDSMENLANPVAGQSELIVPSTQLGMIHVPGVRMDDMHPGCNNDFPHVYHAQSNPPLECSSEPAGRQEFSPIHVTTSSHTNPDVHDPEQGYNRSDEGINCSIDQTVKEQTKQEPSGILRCFSPIDNHKKGSAHGDIPSRSDASASTTGAASIDRSTTTESFNDSNFFIHDGLKGMDTYRSSQREAALTKFRLKRKDRCFEKKVRYQSRKRLAEQRPRVRGQFVRQNNVDAPNI